MLASFSVFVLPPLLFAFCAGFWSSAFVLYIGWSSGPKLNQNNVLCFLGSALGVCLWLSRFLQLLNDQSCAANNCDDFQDIFMYLSLVGATPIGAFPALFLFGPGKKTRKSR